MRRADNYALDVELFGERAPEPPLQVSASELFAALWDGVDGWTSLAHLSGDGQLRFELVRVDDTPTIRAWIDAHQDVHAYYRVCPMADRPEKRGLEADTSCVPALFGDFDWQSIRHPGAPPEHEIRAAVAACPFPPSVVVESGNGVQLLWLLDEPCEPITGKELVARITALVGLKNDRTDLASVLRCPDTNNVHHPVRITTFNTEMRYSAAELDEDLPALQHAVTIDDTPVASREQVAEFLDQYQADEYPAALKAMIAKVGGTIDRLRGARHPSLRLLLWDALREARVGVYPARHAVNEIVARWRHYLVPGERRPKHEEFHLLAWQISRVEALTAEELRPVRERLDSVFGLTMLTQGCASDDAPSRPSPKLNLPAEFWQQRPQLLHVLLAAQATMVSPDAVLVNVLGRLATLIPPCYKLPPVVGGQATFDFMSVVVADTSGGKSAAGDASRRLVPAPDPDNIDDNAIAMDAAIGSGEGIAQFFMVPEKRPDDDGGKPKRTGRHVVGKQALHLIADEGTAFVAQTQRKGTTIVGTLASAWSGAPIGALNADENTRRLIAGGRVRVCAVINMQAANGYKLFSEELESVGFTGRIVFASAHDPAAPPIDALPDWPGPLDWTSPPKFLAGAVELTYAPEIITEIRTTRHGVLTGTVVIDRRRSQYGLLRCKVAGILALWDNRRHVDLTDWALAGQILDTSTAVLDHLAALRQTQEAAHRQTRGQLRGEIDAIAESAHERHAIAELSTRINNRIPAGTEGVGRAELRKAITNSKTRHRFDAALDRLIADGYVTLREGRIKKVKP